MSLTAKQEAFAQGIAKGLGQADAYRAAYDCEKMSDNSIYPNAGKLMANTKIALRIAELQKAVQNKQLWSREMSVKALIQAYKEGTGSTKVAAVKELNAMHGFNEPIKHSIDAVISEVTRTIIKLK